MWQGSGDERMGTEWGTTEVEAIKEDCEQKMWASLRCDALLLVLLLCPVVVLLRGALLRCRVV